MRRVSSPIRVALVAILMLTAGAMPARAQLNTQHIKGTMGLKSGTQPPPHVYIVAPLLYLYNADSVEDKDGNRVPGDAGLTSAAYGGGINVVTTKKLFGGFYG